MSSRPRLRVYLSSTYQDLVEFRAKADETLRRLGYEVIGMEGYVASDARPLDKCLEDVRATDVYVGIVAWRYGFVPPGHDRSITELEYREATHAGKERLIFLTRDDALWPRNQIEDEAEAQVARLRGELREAHVVGFFATPDELAAEVATAITAAAERRLQADVEQLRTEQAEADRVPGRPRRRVVNLPPLEVARFVDRQPEREALRSYLHDAGLRLVKVVGRGGMGKSALVSCVLGEVEDRLGDAAPGPGDGLPDGILYLSARTTGLGLERLEADVRAVLDDEEAHRLAEAWTSRDATVEQKVDTLLAALRGHRLVVLLDALEVVLADDLTIAEAGLRAFVEACLRHSGAPLLVVTSRVDVLVPPEALHAVRVVKVEAGLGAEDACALLRHLDPQNDLGLRHASREQLERVAELTAGIPRALEVLAGILQRDSTASLESLLADEAALGQQTVEELVADGYRRLGESERTVMQALAVLRTPVPATAVNFLLHPWFPGIDVATCLRRLVGSYFVTASRQTGRFAVQALDREHAYRQIPEASGSGYGRSALELRAADFYASLRKPPEQWRSLADVEPQLAEFEHCRRADALDRALEVLQPIDEHYLSLWGHYLRLIELRTSVLDRPVRPDLRAANLAGLGGAYQVLGQYDTAVRHLEQAVEIAGREGDGEAEITYVGNLGRVYRNLGEMDKAVSCLERTFRHHETRGDRRGMAVWSDRLALSYWHLGRLDDAIALARQGLALARETDDRRTEAAALSNVGLMYETAGDAAAARASFAESVEMARRIGDRRGEAIGLGRLAAAHLAAGDPAAAVDGHTEALALAEALGERREQSYQLMGLGRARAAQGDLPGGIGHLRRARDLDVPETSYLAATRLGLALLSAGDRPAAADAFDDAANRCHRRLGRCDRLYAARYALATALVGAAVCGPAWADDQRRADVLTTATREYRLAVANCAGRGIVGAAVADVEDMRLAGVTGLEPIAGLLREARDQPAHP